MAISKKGNETKRRLILATYQKLLVCDASEIVVREVAKASGCTPSAVYRYFDNFEYLITVASTKIYEDYMIEYSLLLDGETDPMKQYVEGWKLFNKHAFKRPDIYSRFMLGGEQYESTLSDALREYMSLFPFSPSISAQAFFYTLLFNDDLYETDLLLLRRAVSHRLLSEEDAVYFSKSNTLLAKGMLEQYRNQDEESRKRGEKECNELILKNLERVYTEVYTE